MRTSLNEIKQIEGHLFNQAAVDDALLFDAMLILDRDMSYKVTLQKKVYQLVRQYGRKKLKAEVESVHQQLFSEARHKTFRQKIMRLFINPG